jgi:hypothetical protein
MILSSPGPSDPGRYRRSVVQERQIRGARSARRYEREPWMDRQDEVEAAHRASIHDLGADL